MTTTAFRWFSLVLTLLAVSAVSLLFFSVAGLVKVLILCALLAYVLDPVASYIESLGLSRAGATVVVFLVLGAVVMCVGLLMYPTLEQELEAMRAGQYKAQTNVLLHRVEAMVRARFGFLGWDNLDLTAVLQNTETRLGKSVSAYLFADLASTIAHVVAIPFVIFFLLKDGREMKKRLISLVPNRYFEFSLNLIHQMDLALGNFLRGQFLDGLIFGLLATLAMWFLGVNYFLFIGCFAGLANLIPYVGPIAGASLAILVVLSTTADVTQAAYVLLAFMGIKLLDDSLIQPLTVAKSVKMHPLLVLLVIIVGGRFFGILGMLLAVPVTGFLKVGYEAGARLIRKYRNSRLLEPKTEPS
jgi:putative permease